MGELQATDQTSNAPSSPGVIPSPALAGLRQLLIARRYAQQLQRDIWDFAVERGSLRSAGLTNNDLRWLICRGLVEHAFDNTSNGTMHRSFSTSGGLKLSKQSCFVLTEEGRRLAEQAMGSDVDKLFAEGSVCKTPDAAVIEHESSATPVWDGQRHQLRLSGVIVKEFKVNSPNQEMILAAFQEEQWPPRIAIPNGAYTTRSKGSIATNGSD
jgi:hypothetical protein